MSTFKAYLITPQTPAWGPREFDTVRDRAKSRAREIGGTFEEIQLPATKAGLVPFLNALERHHAAAEPIVAPEAPAPVPAAPRPLAPVIRAPSVDAGAEAVVDWIFDGATPSQVADIFLGLASRFGEAARPRRVA